MSDKAVVTGQFNLVDEATSVNVASVDLAAAFTSLTGVLEYNKIVRQIVDTDGVVSLDKGGVGDIRGFFIYIKEGTGPITVKHDSNTNGLVVESGLLLFGTIDSITLETASTQSVTVEYVLFE